MRPKNRVYTLQEADIRVIEHMMSTLQATVETIITARSTDADQRPPRSRVSKRRDSTPNPIRWAQMPVTRNFTDLF